LNQVHSAAKNTIAGGVQIVLGPPISTVFINDLDFAEEFTDLLKVTEDTKLGQTATQEEGQERL
jgi:hypothetical protein